MIDLFPDERLILTWSMYQFNLKFLDHIPDSIDCSLGPLDFIDLGLALIQMDFPDCESASDFVSFR